MDRIDGIQCTAVRSVGVLLRLLLLFDDYRYFFYLTNDQDRSAAEIVFDANQRCNQENLLAQLKGGVCAL